MHVVGSRAADDLVDRESMGGKAWWLAVALMRIFVAMLVIGAFTALLITVKTRYQTEQALNADKGVAAITQQQLFSELSNPGASPVGDANRLEVAHQIAKLNADVAIIDQDVAEQSARVDTTGQALIKVAARACRSLAQTWDTAIEPAEAGAKALACLSDPVNASAAAVLRTDLEVAQTAYARAHDEFFRVSKERERRVAAADARRFEKGADLARSYSSIAAHDQLVSFIPVPGVRGALTGLFAAPLVISSVFLVFVAGCLGALIIQLVLITFPGYLPLTLGDGQYFFLRVPTGGMVALLVLLALQSGVTIAGLTDFSRDVGDITVGDPTKLAFVGVLAGAFSENIGKMVVGYVESWGSGLSGGGDTNPQTAEEAEEQTQGAMGPGADAARAASHLFSH